MTRPFICELLLSETEIPLSSPRGSGSHYPCRVMNAVTSKYKWFVPDNQVVADSEFGSFHKSDGSIFVRLLIHFRIPPTDACVFDGENIVVRAANGEVFEAGPRLYWVTPHQAHMVQGSFSCAALRGKDGVELPDLKAYMAPLIVADVEGRVLRIMRLNELPAGADELTRALLVGYKNRELLEIDHFDLEDAAVVLSQRLSQPCPSTRDIRELIEQPDPSE